MFRKFCIIPEKKGFVLCRNEVSELLPNLPSASTKRSNEPSGQFYTFYVHIT